jgi:hypothetical protein
MQEARLFFERRWIEAPAKIAAERLAGPKKRHGNCTYLSKGRRPQMGEEEGDIRNKKQANEKEKK